MEFIKALDALLESYDREGIRYAIIGGVALGALGVPRATMDLDFLVHRDDLNSVHKIMQNLGYQRVFHSDDVSQYRHQEGAWGAVDFLHAYRKISVAMLGRAISVGSSARPMKVLQPGDIIGLKIQAMANDPARRDKEMTDVKMLMGRYKDKLNWNQLAEYFDLFKFQKEFENLKKEFLHA